MKTKFLSETRLHYSSLNVSVYSLQFFYFSLLPEMPVSYIDLVCDNVMYFLQLNSILKEFGCTSNHFCMEFSKTI